MTLGEDPFRKRTPADPNGQANQPYGSQPYGAPPYGSQPYGSQPYGAPQYGQPPGYPPYGAPYGSSYGAPGQPPPGHLGWAITAVIFFWPLAIAAFINYSRVESLWYRGDPAGAQRASDAVKRYGVIALCIGLAIIVLYAILAAAVLSTSSSPSFGG
jgi:hypothetical protein